MRAVSAIVGSLFVAATLGLAGCGGGGEVVIDAPPVVVAVPVVVPAAAFDIIMFVNGQKIPGVALKPDQEQDVDVPVGNNFELATSGPVAWTVVVGGVIVQAPTGSIINYGGAEVLPSLITNARYAANTRQVGPMANPVVVSLIATSLTDPRQEAQLNVVLIK
jgi:hypothetical protein